MRKLIGLLLLAVFFLTGMIIGIQQSPIETVDQIQTTPSNAEVTTVMTHTPPSTLEGEGTKLENVIPENYEEQPTNLTYRAAQSVEKASIWFYNQIIDVAYGISQVFL